MKIYNNGIIIHKESNLESETFENELLENKNVNPETLENNWDKAHQVYNSLEEKSFVEPDFSNAIDYSFPNLPTEEMDVLEGTGRNENYCSTQNGYSKDWENHPAQENVWHLEDEFSQLKSAREYVAEELKKRKAQVKEIKKIRIAHFDTGYDPDHVTYPDKLINHTLERNFSRHGTINDAKDDGSGAQGGHGCGTLSILAGKSYSNNYNFTTSLGLSEEHEVEIVPIRIARSVILFLSEGFEKGLEYVISLYDNPETRCHIITMSMGGAPTRNWAKLVNKAYEKGIFMVTAAGNNFGGITPRTLVFPARFNRVVAACGVTYDFKPYYKTDSLLPQIKIMQGNYGPRKYMRTALSAFTPNVPWAKFGCEKVVSLGGAGTSSATPQIAAAAALYYQTYFEEIENVNEGWKKVELIRKALFESAYQDTDVDENDKLLYFGKGVLQARKALNILPKVQDLQKENEDKVFLPILTLFGEIITSESFMETSVIEEEMFNLEIEQLILNSPDLQELLNNEEKNLEDLTVEDRKKFIEIILNSKEASESLKNYLRSFIL